MADHPNKHLRDALEYAEEHGWTIRNLTRVRMPGVLSSVPLVIERVGWPCTLHREIQKNTPETFDAPWTGALARNRRTCV